MSPIETLCVSLPRITSKVSPHVMNSYGFNMVHVVKRIPQMHVDMSRHGDKAKRGEAICKHNLYCTKRRGSYL